MRIALATRHADRAFIPLALMYHTSSAGSITPAESCASSADVVEEWLAWRPDKQSFEADNEMVKAFVAHLCRQKNDSGGLLSAVRRVRVRVSRRANAVRDAHDVDHLPHPVNADDVRAEQHAGGDGRR